MGKFITMSLTNVIFRFINWLFAILFIFLGIVLQLTWHFSPDVGISDVAIVIAIAGLLISPYVSDLIKQYLRIIVSTQAKMILILLSFVITVSSIQDEVGFTITSKLLNYAMTEEQFKKFHETQQEKTVSEARQNVFLANRTKQLLQLQTWYDSGDYQKVVEQGSPVMGFDSKVKELVDEANKKQQELKKESERVKVLLLMKAEKFYEAYQIAKDFVDDPELKGIAAEAKQKGDEEFEKLKLLYEQGKYDKVIAQGASAADSDCRVRGLVTAAEQTKIRKDERERADKAYKLATKLLKERHFEKVYDITKDFKTDADLQELARQAKEEINSAKEKKILAKLKWISSSNLQQFIEEYTNLVELFPDNEEYRSKLKFYREKLASSKKGSPNLVTRKEYGNKWPFTVAFGELSCSPPGIVTLWANKKTYALNGLANSRGYTKIDEILKSPHVDTLPIISKGLALCQ